MRTVFCFKLDKHAPNKIAKKITCNIFPSTKDLNGFSGMIFKKTDPIDGGEFKFIAFLSEITETEFPGSRNVPIVREIEIANNVVIIYRLIVLIPILPRDVILFKFETPLTSEKKTIGTTSIFKIFKKTSPPNL